MQLSSSPSRPAGLMRGSAIACIFAGLAGLSMSSTGARADAACQALEDAMLANTKTPYHSYASIHFDYATTVDEARRKMKLPSNQLSETIFTGKAVYVRLLPGKWRPLPVSLAQFQANVRASVTGFSGCKRLADDEINGVPMAIYIGKTSQNHRPVVTKVWVSAKGVPVKSETDIDVGGPPGVETLRQRVSTRYEYGDIRAPSMD